MRGAIVALFMLTGAVSAAPLPDALVKQAIIQESLAAYMPTTRPKTWRVKAAVSRDLTHGSSALPSTCSRRELYL